MLRKLYLHAPCVYQVRSLLRENAECHAQIRLLGSEVVGLSEALEIVTKRAHEGEVKQAQILSQASGAMLAQANQSQQNVLSLLR